MISLLLLWGSPYTTVRLGSGVEGVENKHACLHFFALPKTDLCQYMIGDLNQLSFCGVQNC